MLPKVYIVILNWNNLNDTLMCLDSIKKLKYPDFDIIVIDNGSKEDPEIILRKKLSSLTYYRNNSNLGYTGGNNQGMKIALSKGADYIWLLNNDTTVVPDALMNMIDVAESSQQIGIVSSKVVQTRDSSKIEYLGTYINTDGCIKRNFAKTEELIETEINEPKRICLWGTSILIKRNLIENIGFLDDRFFAYYEDMDYSLRAIKSGFVNKVAIGAVIYHQPKSKLTGGIPDYYYFYMTRNEYLFWTKHLEEKDIRNYQRNYVAKMIYKAAIHKELDSMHFAHARLDGMWSAFSKKYGARNQKAKMPMMLRKLILWHPYLLSQIIAKF
ncbi:MAG: glycosyltransferase family 2 protein [Anaerolineaceae bacterium]|nr:glycosyltransferase family 2 protein [Anaerolineaceae bacterium]